MRGASDEQRHLAHVVAGGDVGEHDFACRRSSRDIVTEPRRMRYRPSAASPSLEQIARRPRTSGSARRRRASSRSAAGSIVREIRAHARASGTPRRSALAHRLDRRDQLQHRRGAASRAARSRGPRLTVAERRRPEIRPSSPKNSPCRERDPCPGVPRRRSRPRPRLRRSMKNEFV